MRWAWLVAGLVVVGELALAPAYGPHRDELYFAAAGHHLAWGYPDQPSLVALLARLADLVAPGNLVVLRVPSALAVGGIVAITAALARELTQDRRAATVAAVLGATAVVTVFLGHRLTTQTFSVLAWAAVCLVVARALRRDRPRLWLLAGLLAGIGLNAKHDLVVLLLGLLVGVAVTPATRHHLRGPWPWLGGVLALLLWLPNLLWQASHGWPVLTLGADIRAEYGGPTGALLYVALALVLFSPLMTLVWLRGGWSALREPRWEWYRPLAWSSVVTFVFFLVAGGKSYYLAGAILPLLAAGSVLLVERVRRLAPVVVVLAVSAAVAWPAGVPLLPARAYATSFYPSVDADQLETIGWPQLVAEVRRVVAPSRAARSCSPATTGRPAPCSGTAWTPRSSAATTGTPTGDRRRTTADPSSCWATAIPPAS